MSGIGLAGFHHIAIICSDYARSKRFYTEVLGLRVIAETWRAERRSYKLDLSLPDGGQIELFSFPNPPRAPRTRKPAACVTSPLRLRTSTPVCVNSNDTTSPSSRSVSTNSPAGASPSSPTRTDCRWSFTKPPPLDAHLGRAATGPAYGRKVVDRRKADCSRE